MSIPKKKYRDKVRERLALVKQLLTSDPDRMIKLMRRMHEFDKGSDFHNKIEAIQLLLERDVPALLDAFDQLGQEKNHAKDTNQAGTDDENDNRPGNPDDSGRN